MTAVCGRKRSTICRTKGRAEALVGLGRNAEAERSLVRRNELLAAFFDESDSEDDLLPLAQVSLRRAVVARAEGYTPVPLTVKILGGTVSAITIPMYTDAELTRETRKMPGWVPYSVLGTGIVVAGVASHPGKFGFVTFHNLLRFGYRGALHGVKRDGANGIASKNQSG